MSEDRTTPNGGPPQAGEVQVPPPSRALKVAVYGMGAAIVFMTALLVLGLSLGWNKKSGDAASAAAGNPVVSVPRVDAGETPGGVPGAMPAPLDIAVPKDAAVYTIAGDGKLIALHVRSPGGDEVIVVDTGTNRVVSRIRLKPEGGVTP